MSARTPILLLIAALISCAVLRAVTVFPKPVFYHDESHTYQAATAHVGEAARITYGRLPPYGHWVPAAQWKRLLRPEGSIDLALVGRDALAYDVHPPLYYWLLHLLCFAIGTHLWTGTLLNAVFDVLTVFALYRFAKYVLRDRIASALATFVWATTAGALQVAVVEARMYSLLTLIAVLFVDQAVRYFYAPTGSRRWPRLILIAVFTAAGALTHHHFGLLIAGAFGWCVLTCRRSPGAWRRIFLAVAAVLVGYGVLVLVHPVFFGTGYKHLSDTHLPDAAGLVNRGRQTIEALSQFLFERRFGSTFDLWIIIALAAVPPVIFVLAVWKAPRLEKTSSETSDATNQPSPGVTSFPVALGIWMMFITIALYLIGVTPAHAMSARYLAMTWPFLAISAALLVMPRAKPEDVRHEPRWSTARLTGLSVMCVLAVTSGAISAALQWRDLDWHPGAARADALVRSADHVIIDNIGRGHWPRPVWRLREDAQVLIALPNDLLHRPSPWRKGLVPGTIYISPARSTEVVRKKLIDSFGRDNTIEYVGHLYGIGDVYLLGEHRTPSVRSRTLAARPASRAARPTTRPATSDIQAQTRDADLE